MYLPFVRLRLWKWTGKLYPSNFLATGDQWGLIQTQRSQEIIQELFNEWKFRSRNSSISSIDTEIDCPTGIQEIQLRIKDNR